MRSAKRTETAKLLKRDLRFVILVPLASSVACPNPRARGGQCLVPFQRLEVGLAGLSHASWSSRMNRKSFFSLKFIYTYIQTKALSCIFNRCLASMVYRSKSFGTAANLPRPTTTPFAIDGCWLMTKFVYYPALLHRV